jgi:hypothetical protein
VAFALRGWCLWSGDYVPHKSATLTHRESSHFFFSFFFNSHLLLLVWHTYYLLSLSYPIFNFFFTNFFTSFHPPCLVVFTIKLLAHKWIKDDNSVPWWLRVWPKQNYVLGFNGAHSCTLYIYPSIRKNMTHLLRCHFLTSLKYEFTLGVNYSQYMKWN